VHQDALLQMRTNRLREYGNLNVLADARQFSDRVTVRDRRGRLRDDRAGIELLGDVVRGSAD